MKKIIIALTLMLAVVIPQAGNAQTLAPQAASCVRLTRDLTIGSRGSDVTQLQGYLYSSGFISEVPTGYFGTLTQKAVAAFQRNVGISPASGYVGALTRAYIQSTTCGGTTTTIPGCTPGAIYSATTGQPCNPTTPVGTTTPIIPGCPKGVVYSSVTGQLCNPSNQVTLIYPKGGENFKTGDPMDIQWTPAKPVSVIEIVAKDGNFSAGIYGPKYGNTNPITSGMATATISYNFPPNNYYVRVTLTDGTIANSNSFTINTINHPTIPGCTPGSIFSSTTGQSCNPTGTTTPITAILNPKGGEIFHIGDTMNVNWLKQFFPTANISLILRSMPNQAWAPFDSGSQAWLTENDGSQSWTIGNIPTGQYVLRITCVPSSNCTYQDSKVFTIASSTPVGPTTPFIQVYTPNGGEYYLNNQTITVGYGGTNLGTTTILLNNQTLGTVIQAYDYGGGTGKTATSIDLTKGTGIGAVPAGQYRVTVCDEHQSSTVALGKPLCDTSDNYFTIASSTVVKPSISVMSPSSSDTFKPGQTVTVRYSTSNFPRPVKVQIQLNKGAQYPYGPYNPVGSSATPYMDATGSYSYTLPSDLKAGNDYSFMVRSDYPNTEQSADNGGNSSNFTVTANDTLACTKNWDAQGDVNNDGKVDFSDLTLYAQNNGKNSSTTNPLYGDANKDGKVDFMDLAIISRAYNSCRPAPVAGSLDRAQINTLLQQSVQANALSAVEGFMNMLKALGN